MKTLDSVLEEAQAMVLDEIEKGCSLEDMKNGVLYDIADSVMPIYNYDVLEILIGNSDLWYSKINGTVLMDVINDLIYEEILGYLFENIDYWYGGEDD